VVLRITLDQKEGSKSFLPSQRLRKEHRVSTITAFNHITLDRTFGLAEE
jgi:hypothetical protein